MAITRAGTLIDMLRDSRLLEPAQIDELGQTPEALDADPELLAACLQELGWVTPFQLERLRQGRPQDLKIASFLLMDRLGPSPTGPAYKARRPGKSGSVALKLIPKSKFATPQVVAQFMQDVRIAAQLQHPNLAPVVTVGQQGTLFLFAREFVEGTDLAQAVKDNGPLPVARACNYLRQAALGLQYAHEKGLSHRRIKPCNLVASNVRSLSNGDAQPSAVVKLVDVGLAQLKPRMTAGTGVDVQADLNGLGRTFHYLLTAQMPSPADGGPVAPLASASSRLAKLRPGVPVEVERILAKLLASRPEDRYKSAAEVAQALEPFSHEPVEASARAINGTGAALPAAPQPADAAVPVATPLVQAMTATTSHEPAAAVAMPLGDAAALAASPEQPEPASVPYAMPLTEAVPLGETNQPEKVVRTGVAEPTPVALEGMALPVPGIAAAADRKLELVDLAKMLRLEGMPTWSSDDEWFGAKKSAAVGAAVQPESFAAPESLVCVPTPASEAPHFPELAPAFSGEPLAAVVVPASEAVPRLVPPMPPVAAAGTAGSESLAAGTTTEPGIAMGTAVESLPSAFTDVPAEESITFPMGAAEAATTAGRRKARKKLSRSSWMWLIVGALLHLIAAVILIIAIMAMMKEPPPPTKYAPRPTVRRNPTQPAREPTKNGKMPTGKGDVNPFDDP